jgi:hypothetical protein
LSTTTFGLREFMRFIAAVGSQAGEDHKYFHDEDEAESWLLCSGRRGDGPTRLSFLRTEKIATKLSNAKGSPPRTSSNTSKRIRPSITHDANALEGWQSRHTAAQKAVAIEPHSPTPCFLPAWTGGVPAESGGVVEFALAPFDIRTL